MVLSLLSFSLLSLLLCFFGGGEVGAVEVTYAVNCGGDAHKDWSTGISYLKDTGFSGGIISDAGATFRFPRVSDDHVYRTERYDVDSFSYAVQLAQQGQHTMVLKFSEVYFESAGSKVFSVKVGGHLVAYQLDPYSKVGKGVPHDEYIDIIRDGDKLRVNGVEATSRSWSPSKNELVVEFVKLVGRDNPKVNAIVIYKAALKDVPKLQPHDPTPRLVQGRTSDPDFHEELSFDDDADEVGLEARNLETITVRTASAYSLLCASTSNLWRWWWCV
eukprot:GHVS01079147.1.p1 GENE.GHVS01079147.1~~GHVS01079147.1.p1  ORF type:complete len:274 (+),score=35.63 GHVS01079147.1:28-849(+)